MSNFPPLDNVLRIIGFVPDEIKENSAWLGHIPFAAWLMQIARPTVFVELGSHWGHSYFAFCKAAKEAKIAVKCYAVDTWEGDEHADYYGEKVFQFVDAHNKSNYASFSRLLKSRFDDVLMNFGDGSVDLLHIDGLHTYEAVKHDFDSWLPKMAPGGIILFHDTNVREGDFGVWKLWDELKARYSEWVEFNHSHGLGILRLPGATSVNLELDWLFDADNQIKIRDFFSALGTQRLDQYKLQATIEDVKNLLETLGNRDQQIIDYHNLVGNRDQQIIDYHNLVGKRDQQIQELNHLVGNRDQQIQELNHLVGNRDQHIHSIESINQGLMRNIQQLEEKITSIESYWCVRLRKIFRKLIKGIEK